MEAIVLAGGLGTRLASRLINLPKPMAPVAGRPFLEILLARLQLQGCRRALLSVGHLHQTIQNHFGSTYQSMEISYAVEDRPLGTGGAIRAAMAMASEDSVLVLNGDTFLDCDAAALLAEHRRSGAQVTMAVVCQPDISRFGGVVLQENRVIGFQEKGCSGPGWINAGVYALRRDLRWPLHLPERFSWETDVLAAELPRLAPHAFSVEGFFLDIGVPEDLDRAQTLLSKPRRH